MHRFVEFLCLASCVAIATARCTTSKFNDGPKSRMTCTNSNIDESKVNLTSNFAAISFSKSQIGELPSNVYGLNNVQLDMLSFQDCGIKDIANDTFRGLFTLKKLILSHNNISTIQVIWFLDIPNLEHLDLSFNKITTLPSVVYLNLRNLRAFEMNDNLLTCIPTENLELLVNLKNMLIHKNPLTLRCRSEIIRALQQRNVRYDTHEPKTDWLDGILHECTSSLSATNATNATIVGINANFGNNTIEREMNNCVTLKMFNQLSAILEGLPTTESLAKGCSSERRGVTTCLESRKVMTNGDLVSSFLTLLDETSL